MENKNFLLAIALSFGFLMFWSMVVMPRLAPKAPITATPSAASTPGAAPLAPGEQVIVPAHADSVPTVLADTILRNESNEVVFSPQGGGIRHWRLMMKGQEVDLVNIPDSQPLPLATFPNVPFTIRQRDMMVMMQATLPNGLKLSKTLALNPNGHLHDLTFRFDNPTHQAIELSDFEWGWGPGLGTAESERKENTRQTRALSMGKLKAHVQKPGDYPEFGPWSGIDNRYFLVAFLPVSGAKPTFSVAKTPVTNAQGKKEEDIQVRVHQKVIVPPEQYVLLVYQIYAGPKGYTQLGKYHKGLEEAVDFGVFSPLGKLILKAIYWLQGQTGNYGWAIIILTVILQLLLTPLTIKSFKATMAMKLLQPQIAALQKAYKSDPKRLNIEMMNLYKKSGTNPFGGCLPMLLQLPIFWALFTTLRNAYELRGAPFIGWIHDLSAADPYHVLPVVMGGAMFLQQRMSGASADPTQRQMMYMMPIMFTVMFFNFPAGLVLYWFTNNLITMAIQWNLLRMHNKPTALEVVR